MTRTIISMVALALAISGLSQSVIAAGAWGLKPGSVQLQSAGPLTFGPDGILLVGDAKAAAVIAIDTEDNEKPQTEGDLKVAGLDKRVAEHLGSGSVVIVDMAANPISGNVYLSVTASGKPSIVRVERTGEVSTVTLDKIDSAMVKLTDAPADEATGQGRRRRNRRTESITDIVYSDGRVLVSGLTSKQSASGVRELDFPFSDSSEATSVEIYHGAHGKYEDYSAIRTFVPFVIDGEPSLLAGYTCTPLVKFPVKELKGGKVRGTTIAELGNRNRPLDMIVYEQSGKSYLLMSNSARGVMKISTEDIERSEGITSRVSGGGVAGQTYETIESLKNVVQMDKLNDTHAVLMVKQGAGGHDLVTVPLP